MTEPTGGMLPTSVPQRWSGNCVTRGCHLDAGRLTYMFVPRAGRDQGRKSRTAHGLRSSAEPDVPRCRFVVDSIPAPLFHVKGYTADEIIGRQFSVFFIADDVNAGKPERELATAAAHGHSRDEGWRVRKDGSRFWANVTLTAIVDCDGHLDGFAKITRDDTDRRQMDEQVRRLELLTERERIAHAMHETIVHSIFEASLTMEGAVKLISHPVPRSGSRPPSTHSTPRSSRFARSSSTSTPQVRTASTTRKRDAVRVCEQ
jgi:PAS domain S-box-containing protein